MYKIAVCDDEVEIAHMIEEVILNYSKKEFIPLEVDVFTFGRELCKNLESGEYYDLIFLDIELTDMTGVYIGKKIRNELKNVTTHLVYISSYSGYALDLFEIRPLDFIIKSKDTRTISKKDIEKNISTLIELIKRAGIVFSFGQGRDEIRRKIQDILYFKIVGRIIIMVTTTGEEYFNGSLKKIYEDLKQYNFFYTGRNYLVNYYHVIDFKYDTLTMSNKSIIEIAQPRRQKVRKMQSIIERDGFKNENGSL